MCFWCAGKRICTNCEKVKGEKKPKREKTRNVCYINGSNLRYKLCLAHISGADYKNSYTNAGKSQNECTRVRYIRLKVSGVT